VSLCGVDLVCDYIGFLDVVVVLGTFGGVGCVLVCFGGCVIGLFLMDYLFVTCCFCGDVLPDLFYFSGCC